MYPLVSCCSFSFSLSIIHTTLVTLLDVSSCVQTHATDVSNWWQWEGPANSWDELWNQTEGCQSVHSIQWKIRFTQWHCHVHSRSGFPRHSKLTTVSRIALQDFPTLLASWPFNGATDVMALALDEQSAGQCWGATVLSITLKLSCFTMFYICFIFSTANTLQPCFELCDHKLS